VDRSLVAVNARSTKSHETKTKISTKIQNGHRYVPKGDLVSHHEWSGDACLTSRRRVNSDVSTLKVNPERLKINSSTLEVNPE
jgi:hypothetical protein